MKNRLIIATLLAVVCAVSLYLYGDSLRKEVAGGQKIGILVATKELKPGTRITKAMIAVQEVPIAYRHPQALERDDDNKILGRPVTTTVLEGAPLLWPNFEVGQTGGASSQLSKNLQKGQRALTVPVDMQGSLAGMLRPGDHIDMLGTFARGQGGEFSTVTLLQNVVVLATGDTRSEAELSSGSAPKGFTNITVSLDPEEAELLAFAVQRGPLAIALRAQEDVVTIEDLPEKNFGDIFEVQRRAAFAHRHKKGGIEALKAQ
jgi:pilus assembly protein CpaB